MEGWVEKVHVSTTRTSRGPSVSWFFYPPRYLVRRHVSSITFLTVIREKVHGGLPVPVPVPYSGSGVLYDESPVEGNSRKMETTPERREFCIHSKNLLFVYVDQDILVPFEPCT